LIFLQTPIPSHALVPLHAGLLSVIPFGMFEHAPRFPATLHAMHAPVHVLLQQ